MADETNAAPPASKPAPAPAPSITEEIREWFRNSMHVSVVTRDTQVFNHVRGEVEKLIAHLEHLFGKGG